MRASFFAGMLTLIAVNSSTASVVTFTNRPDWLIAAGGGLAFESFENAFTGSPISQSFPGMLATTQPTGVISQSTLFPTQGSFTLRFDGNSTTGSQTEMLTFTFSSPITSFGIEILAFGDVGVPVELFVSTNTGSVTNLLLASTPPILDANNMIFFGVVDFVGFSSISFLDTGIIDAVFYDAAEFGGIPLQLVPEPWSLSLLGTFACCLGLRRLGRITGRRSAV